MQGKIAAHNGFKSHLPHQTGNPEATKVSGFFLLPSILFSVNYYSFRVLPFQFCVNFCKIISHGISHGFLDGFVERRRSCGQLGVYGFLPFAEKLDVHLMGESGR